MHENEISRIVVDGALTVHRALGARLAETDGMLVLRHLFGFSGAALVAEALSPSATRTAPDVIDAALEGLKR